jgi:hypothetical protein
MLQRPSTESRYEAATLGEAQPLHLTSTLRGERLASRSEPLWSYTATIGTIGSRPAKSAGLRV